MDNIKEGPNNFKRSFPVHPIRKPIQNSPIPVQRKPLSKPLFSFSKFNPIRKPLQANPMKRPPFHGYSPISRFPSPNKTNNKFNISKKMLLIGGSILAFIIVLILIIALSGNKEYKDPVINQNLEMKIENVQIERNSVKVNLEIDPKETNLVGIKFIFENEGKFEVIKEDISIDELTNREFVFELEKLSAFEVKKVLVSPIFEDKEKGTFIGSVQDTYLTEETPSKENNTDYEDYIPNKDYSDYESEYWQEQYQNNYSTNNQSNVINNTNNSQINNTNPINYTNTTSFQNTTANNTNPINYTNITYPTSVCGNGILETGESCELNNLAGETCQSFGFASGTLGCRKTCEFDTRYCVNEEEVNTTPTCVSHSYSACYAADLYWYNSCGSREEMKQNCNSTQTCSNGVCVNNAGGDSGCTTHFYSSCYNGDVYWYNSCGVREGIRNDCTSTQTCTNNACVDSCTTHSTYSCYNGDVYWYNSCGVREGIRNDCTSSQTCSNNACVNNAPTCTSNSYSQCYNGDVYWYNSCNVRGSIRYDCTSSQTCSNNVCVNNQVPVNNDFSFTHYFISSNPPSGSYIAEQAIADYDNDGDLDFVVGLTSGSTGKLYLYNNNGGSNWALSEIGNVPMTSLGAWAYDINNDGRMDVISASVWYQNNGGGSFTMRTYDSNINSQTDHIHDLILADLNNDGKKDVVVHSEDIGTFWYNIPSNPTSTWTKTTIDTTCVGANPKVHGGFSPGGAGDLDGDGDKDIFRANAWFENRNNGANWVMHTLNLPGVFQGTLTYGKSTRSFIIDIDNDGDNDVVFTESDKIYSKAGIIYNTNGNFGSYQLFLLPQTATGKRGSLHSLQVADFNLDGKLDILSLDQEDMIEMDNTIPLMRWYMWTNTGSGWTEQVLFNNGLGGHDTIAGDSDQDGDLDLLTKTWYRCTQNSNSGIKHVDWYENNEITQSSNVIKLSMNPSSGWHEHGNGLWQSVNGGYITGQQDPPGSGNGGFLISDQTFGDYEVVFDVWPDYGIDSGIFLRNTNTDEQAYQVTIDYQPENPMGSVYITSVGDYREFSLVDEDEITGSSQYFDSDAWSYIWKENDWNQFRISIEGNPPKIIVWINGFKVHEYTDTQARFPSSGYIALQVHPGASEWPSGKVVRFRNIKVYPK